MSKLEFFIWRTPMDAVMFGESVYPNRKIYVVGYRYKFDSGVLVDVGGGDVVGVGGGGVERRDGIVVNWEAVKPIEYASGEGVEKSDGK